MVWDAETILLLRRLWAAGHSTAEIGRRMGVSKNAIVGKAHRLDLDGRPSPIRRDAAAPPRIRATFPHPVSSLPPLPSELTAEPPPPRPAPILRPVVARPAPVCEPVRLDRRRTCEFLSGERRKMVACGEHVVTGSPYCPEHHRLCFVPIRRRAGVEEAA